MSVGFRDVFQASETECLARNLSNVSGWLRYMALTATTTRMSLLSQSRLSRIVECSDRAFWATKQSWECDCLPEASGHGISHPSTLLPDRFQPETSRGQ